MQIITIGKRLIPAEQIALVERFDPTANPEFKPEKDYKSRIILLNRDTVLAEVTPQEFAAAHGLHMLFEDDAALSSVLVFRVETFVPTETFKPEKGYRSRIKWRDRDGNEQSKLLVTEPETIVLELSHHASTANPKTETAPERPARRRRAPCSAEAARAK
jgi:hypothetical protein